MNLVVKILLTRRGQASALQIRSLSAHLNQKHAREAIRDYGRNW